jgi:two-component SAPR family response regulator
MTAEMLRNDGYQVLVAAHAAQAREMAQQLQKIRPQMKVLYMSGYAEDSIAHRGILEPGIQFIAKPFRPQAPGKKVREVLDAAGPA